MLKYAHFENLLLNHVIHRARCNIMLKFGSFNASKVGVLKLKYDKIFN